MRRAGVGARSIASDRFGGEGPFLLMELADAGYVDCLTLGCGLARLSAAGLALAPHREEPAPSHDALRLLRQLSDEESRMSSRDARSGWDLGTCARSYLGVHAGTAALNELYDHDLVELLTMSGDLGYLTHGGRQWVRRAG